jgi:O-antigen/teichoic acid export membrane protein
VSRIESPSLRRNIAWTIGGNVVYAACQWGMLVALARLSTPEVVGDFAFALALTAPIVIFAMLNMRAAQATDQRGEFAFADYVALRVLCLSLASLAIAGVLVFGGFDRTTVWVVSFVALAKICDALSDVVYGLLQQREWMRRIAVSRILQGTLQLAGLVLVLRAGGGIVAATAAMAAFSLAVTLSYDLASVWRVRRTLRGERAAAWALRPQTLRKLFVLSLPLGIAAVLDSLNANLPRYALDAQGGRTALGYYAAIAYFLVGQGTVVIALADVARPRLARAFLGGDSLRSFLDLTLRLSVAAAGMGAIGLLVAGTCGERVLRLLYGEAYAGQAALFAWMMAVAVPWNVAGIATTALAAARSFRAVSLCFVAMTAATALGAAALVPRYGTIGAAWALGIGMLVRLAVAGAGLWTVCGARIAAPGLVEARAR